MNELVTSENITPGFVKIAPSEKTGNSAFVSTKDDFVSFSSLSREKKDTNSTQPALNQTPNTTATVFVTAAPVDPTYAPATPLTVSVGYVVLIGLGAYALGRVQQFFMDAKRGMGPKLPGRRGRD